MTKKCIILKLIVISGLVGCHSPPIEKRPVEKMNEDTLRITAAATQNIHFFKASLLEFPEQLPVMGKISVVEDRTQVIPARVAGRIESILIASGEFVAQNQLIARLYSPDYIAAQEEYLQSIKRGNEQSKHPGDHLSDLDNLSLLSKKRLENMGLNSKDIGKIKNSDSLESRLLPIHSPRDGFVITKNAVIGNLVNMGDTLFIIADLKKVWFTGDIYPEDLSKVHSKQEVIIKAGEGGSPLSGKVSFISPVVDPTTRTIKIRALMDNPKNILRADMYVQGNLTLKKKEALFVPNHAIIQIQNEHAIFKKIAPLSSVEGNLQGSVVQLTKVIIGQQEQELTEIKKGIQEGDEVVSDGALLLYGVLNER